MAATSLTLAAIDRQPASFNDIKSRAKCTPSTSMSVVITLPMRSRRLPNGGIVADADANAADVLASDERCDCGNDIVLTHRAQLRRAFERRHGNSERR